ncbi:hypothetical protein [Candidatus Protochlamydia phocaeensis]|uniref:hypothetical protein n=1 Tax=Candidatus Protochlamydia phocaeensis TaxID=1414722 RepID=UPI0008381AB4|nr:hypothetical protein [Candidatus Protochlamydia phocaeensis]
MNFRKDNISIHYFNEYIPESPDDGYTKRVENYLLKILENGGIVFIGHHGQAYYAFEPFRAAYNHLNCANIQMYICCADVPPYSTPKIYFNNPCSNQELDEFFEFIYPHIREFWELIDDWEVEDKVKYKDEIEPAYQLLDSLTQGLKTNFIFYKDMLHLPYDVIRHSDGSLQLHLMETAEAA